MSLERNFKIGRNSEQFYNEELFKMYEAIKYLLSIPDNIEIGPNGDPIDGALWLDRTNNELNKYNKQEDRWENVFKNKFKVTDQIMEFSTPENPVYGQLWINQGVLMYYNNVEWQAVKASSYEDSGINLSSFQDFSLLTPLSKTGDTVTGGTEDKYQYLIPNIEVGKFFVGNQYKYDYEEMNNVSFQYPVSKLFNYIPSWVHVNPGKLRNIKKKLIKINKDSQFVEVELENTEFYVFKQGYNLGRFIMPKHEVEGEIKGNYDYHHNGIYLDEDIAGTYDYILVIKYEFSWIRNAGKLRKISSENQNLNYYMAGFAGPINVFVEGYDLDNKFYSYDQYSELLSIDDPDFDQNNMDSIMMRSIKREYGIIRELNIELKGIIKLREKYNNPLVFVNGQALHSSLSNIEIDEIEGIILVEGAAKNMSYSVMELEWDVEEGETPETLFFDSGYVGYTNYGDPIEQIISIHIQDMASKIGAEENLILFIDGMMIKSSEIIRNYGGEYITVNGLELGQEYLLLHDKNNSFLYDENSLTYALVTGKIDDSIVYMNDYLICNSSIIITQESQEEISQEASDGEIRLFIVPTELGLEEEYKIWNGYNKAWEDLSSNEINHVNTIAESYENNLNGIIINTEHTNEDIFHVYGYNYANTISSPLLINSYISENEKRFYISNHFIPKTNSLQVYLDGVRQYEIEEFIDGSGFELPEEFTGKVTYIIEKPEQGRSKACEREILDETNAVEGAINVYKTNISLYPGRVTVYIGGLRQPINSFTILDNNTISFKDKNTMLIKSTPITKIIGEEEVEIEKTIFDKILIEVRQDYNRKERTINITEDNTQSINLQEYAIEESVLETQDEILIYLNGAFSGLKNNTGYKKNIFSKEIDISSENFLSILNEDSLYNYLESNIDAMNKWIEKNGAPYEKILNNKITLEWR